MPAMIAACRERAPAALRHADAESAAMVKSSSEVSCVNVSVRVPAHRPVAADEFCRGFGTGGGRRLTAGINHLPAADVDRFADQQPNLVPLLDYWSTLPAVQELHRDLVAAVEGSLPSASSAFDEELTPINPSSADRMAALSLSVPPEVRSCCTIR